MAEPRGLVPFDEWKRGWGVVLSASAGFSYTGIAAMSLAVFMGPLAKEFGWSRTFISSGFTISAVLTGLFSIPMGMVVDRYGSRRVALPGLLGAMLCVAAFGTLDGSTLQWFALWTVYGLVALAIKPAVWTTAIVGAFAKGAGLALGLTLAGGALAQIFAPPLATWLINSFGWRLSYPILSLGWGGVVLALCWLFLFDHGRRPSAKQGEPVGEEGAAPAVAGLSLAEAWRSRALWMITVSTLVTMLLTTGLMLHQIQILTEAGIPRMDAALLASLSGAAAIAGKLVTGVLLDRFRANLVGGLTLAASAIAFALLMDDITSPVLITVAMLVNGYTQGSKLQVAVLLTAKYAGMRNFAAIYGAIGMGIAVGSGLGPMLAGATYDQTGSYSLFLLMGVVGSLVCGVLILLLPRYPASL